MPTQSYADSSDCTLTVLSSILRDWLSAFRAQVRKNSAAALLKTMTTPCPLPAVMSARYPLDQQTCLLNISSFSGGGDTSFVWAHHPLSLARIRWAVPVAVEEEIIAPSRKDWGAPKKHEAAISVHTLERGGKMVKLLCTQHIFRWLQHLSPISLSAIYIVSIQDM